MTRKEKIIEILRSKTVIDKMGNLLVTDNYNDIADAILVALPIDVPSEEEIKEESLNGQINLHDHNWMNWLNDEEQGLFIMAAKWAINEIIERNKK